MIKFFCAVCQAKPCACFNEKIFTASVTILKIANATQQFGNSGRTADKATCRWVLFQPSGTTNYQNVQNLLGNVKSDETQD